MKGSRILVVLFLASPLLGCGGSPPSLMESGDGPVSTVDMAEDASAKSIADQSTNNATDLAQVLPTDGGGGSFACGPGLDCQGRQYCGYTDGYKATACDCGADAKFVCGDPVTVPSCSP